MRWILAGLVSLAMLVGPAEAAPSFDSLLQAKLLPQIEKLLLKLEKDGRALEIDGMPVFNGQDKFLPGKIAVSLVDYLLTLPPGDPKLPRYLAHFRKVARLTVDDADDTWGAYYYLVALDKLKQAGLLDQALDRLTAAKLRVRLDWRMFVDPEDFTLIDHPNNYYVVAYGIARLRMRMGWENGAGAARIYEKVADHYRRYSGEFGFADETDGEGRFDRYSILLSAELAHHFVEGGETPPAEVMGWLGKSADAMLVRLQEGGQGFEYGRSLGPYGETAIIEVLTTAAWLGILSESEKALAYAYICRAAERYFTFWVDPATGSVDLWDKGRRTDAYRGKFRILGENLSLAHQFAYTAALWDEMGFKNKEPMTGFAQALEKLPKRRVTWFDHGRYDRLLVTLRDKGHVIGLPVINGGATQHMNSPYFPIPFSRGMLSGVADGTQPLLLPQFTLADGVVLMPLAFFKDAAARTEDGKTLVAWRQTEMDRMGQTAPVPDDRLSVSTSYVLESGRITRTDVYTPKAPLDLSGIRLDFASFSDLGEAKGGEIRLDNGAVTRFSLAGLDSCKAETIHEEKDYEADDGPMRTRVICTSGARTVKEPFTLSWRIDYR